MIKCRYSVPVVSTINNLTKSEVTYLSDLIHSQSRLGHLSIPQEFQWHPDQMALDLIQFLTNLLDRLEGIEEVTLLAILRSEDVILLKGLDMVVRVGTEKHAIHFGVDSGPVRPHLPHVVAQRIRDEVVLGSLVDMIHAGVDGLAVGVLGDIVVLGGKQAHVLPP